MKRLPVFVLALCLSFPSSPLLAHGGGLDSRGCHRETATGGYHCHRSSDRDDVDWSTVGWVIGGLVVAALILRALNKDASGFDQSMEKDDRSLPLDLLVSRDEGGDYSAKVVWRLEF